MVFWCGEKTFYQLHRDIQLLRIPPITSTASITTITGSQLDGTLLLLLLWKSKGWTWEVLDVHPLKAGESSSSHYVFNLFKIGKQLLFTELGIYFHTDFYRFFILA